MIRFVGWLIFAIVWVGSLLLGWFGGSRRNARVREANRTAGTGAQSRQPAGTKLHRDPICGTHVPDGISLTLEHGGETHHFCSAECREKFRAQLQSRSA